MEGRINWFGWVLWVFSCLIDEEKNLNLPRFSSQNHFQASFNVLTGKVGTVTMVTGLRTAACPTSCGWGASTAVGFPSDGLPWLITAALFTWPPLVLAWGLAWTCGRVWWAKVWVMWPTMVGWETDTPWGYRAGRWDGRGPPRWATGWTVMCPMGWAAICWWVAVAAGAAAIGWVVEEAGPGDGAMWVSCLWLAGRPWLTAWMTDGWETAAWAMTVGWTCIAEGWRGWAGSGGGGPGAGAMTWGGGGADGEAVVRTPDRGSAACWIDKWEGSSVWACNMGGAGLGRGVAARTGGETSSSMSCSKLSSPSIKQREKCYSFVTIPMKPPCVCALCVYLNSYVNISFQAHTRDQTKLLQLIWPFTAQLHMQVIWNVCFMLNVTCTRGGGSGGLVILWLDGLTEDSVNFHDIHALAELVLQLS